MNPEILLLIFLFLSLSALVFLDVKAAFSLLLFFSVLLHKEFFSIYKWDLLPVRILMLSFAALILWFFVAKKRKNLREIISDPFVILLTLMWITRGASILFSKNMTQSILLFGFFSTVYLLGIFIYTSFFSDSSEVLAYVKKYIYIIFGVCVFAVVQIAVYLKYGIIFGALWNVPGHLPRLGATFWDVNHFGGLLAAVLPVLGALILAATSLRNKFLYALMFIPMAGVLALTNSRSAWLLAFVAFVAFITVNTVRRVGVKGIVYICLTVVLLFIPLVREYRIKSSPFRAAVRQYFNYRIDSFDSHFLLLKGSFEVFGKYPILGGGYGSFFEQFSKASVAGEFFGRDPAGLNVRVPAHTIWGEVLAETGGFGISVQILFSFLVLAVLFYVALKSRHTEEYLVAGAMGSSILGWYFAGIFYSYNAEFFWIVIFLYFIYGVTILGRTDYLSKIAGFVLEAKGFPLLIVAVIALLLIFWRLGSNRLLPWDEAIYSQVAKNMVVSKEYFVQRWVPDEIWLEKPPVYMWLAALSMSVFGVNEWAARMPSAFFGFLTILLVYFFGKRLFGRIAGFVSAFSLLTTFQYLYYARMAMLDVTMTFFLTLCLYLYLEAQKKPGYRYWVFSGIAGGLAVMTKSVVGFLALPVISLNELYLCLTGEAPFDRGRVRKYACLLLSYTAVFLPWHLEAFRRFGGTFLRQYLGYHVLTRVVSGIEDKGRHPVWWYLTVLKVSMRLWFAALLASYPAALFRAFAKKDKNYAFLIIWSLVVFVFFSLSKSKVVWYIMPIYPALSLMIGGFSSYVLDFFVKKAKIRQNILVKALVIYVGVCVTLVYLYANKNLVYLSDLTGPQANLLQTKDKEFGADELVYADRIERPLVIYYTRGPYEVVDFTSLKEKLAYPIYDDRIVFITKESRYKSLAVQYPHIKLTRQEKEWVLGYMPSTYERDQEQLRDVQRLIDRFEGSISEALRKGDPAPAEAADDLNRRMIEKADILKRITVGLETMSR
ncbi:glycosyltransferase family 39 protein [candidate division WWE3 bacterium]|nr:glycosyltransferase family 39 protein [candidate division WWE3 bacterium]